MKEFFKELGAPWKIYSITIGIFLLVYFGIPYILTREAIFGVSYTATGQIGDTFGGLTAPIVAFVAAFLTFIAFWAQFKSNKAQTEQFEKQANKDNKEIIESNFFRLLEMHNRNIDEFRINETITKRSVFKEYFKEFKASLKILELSLSKNNITSLESFDKVNIAYLAFFTGVYDNSDKLLKSLLSKYDSKFVNSYIDLLRSSSDTFNSSDKKFVPTLGITDQLNYRPFHGHLEELGHYFRNLFLIVKYIHDSSLDFKDKYNYLKILRSQLSAQEQLILYYNSICQMGKAWIENGYVRDYKIIKNLPIPSIDFSPKPKEYLEKFKISEKDFFEWDEMIA